MMTISPHNINRSFTFFGKDESMDCARRPEMVMYYLYFEGHGEECDKLIDLTYRCV